MELDVGIGEESQRVGERGEIVPHFAEHGMRGKVAWGVAT
jgi:hypothetical protein